MNSRRLEEILLKIDNIQIDENFDLLVAIAWGGIIPAQLLNRKLNRKINTLFVNFRDIDNQPKYDSPQLYQDIDFDYDKKNILLVDDRVKTGKTFQFAKTVLKEAALIKTFAINGKADYALYNEDCFRFPWK
jgi:xanthine phosphoribosyltransferase